MRVIVLRRLARDRMKLRNHGRPTGFSKLVAPFMKIAVRRANQQDLKALKQLLESVPTGT